MRLGLLLDLPIIRLDEIFWTSWSQGPDPLPVQIRTKPEELAR